MDLPNLARDLDKLATADAVVADSYVRYIFRKAALYFLASLVAGGGIVLLGLSLYWLLDEKLGPIGATALIGIMGCLLAGIIAVIAVLQRPGREFSVALEMRRSTIASLEQGLNAAQPNIGPSYVYPSTEALITSVAIPLLGALIRSLTSSRSKAVEKSAELSDVNDIHEGSPKS